MIVLSDVMWPVVAPPLRSAAGPCLVFHCVGVCVCVCVCVSGGESVAALAGLRGVSALPHGTSWQSHIPTAHIHTQTRTH